jgi:hypothetical protein
MSYFMTSAGPRIEMGQYAPVELVAAALAQDYIRDRASEIGEVDGGPLFLVHDGESQTSHDIVVPAYNQILDRAPLGDTDFGKILTDLLIAGHTVRVWDAGAMSNKETLGLTLAEYDSPDDALRAIVDVVLGKSVVKFHGRLTRRSTGAAKAAR